MGLSNIEREGSGSIIFVGERLELRVRGSGSEFSLEP
jgi:hypothetical protein